MDISELLLSFNIPGFKREDRFCITGEDDGQGCIILHRYYLYNPKRKSKPIIIPVKDFLATAICFTDGIYHAHYLPPEKRESPEVCKRRLRRLKRCLKKLAEEEGLEDN